jgi:Zn-finger protein
MEIESDWRIWGQEKALLGERFVRTEFHPVSETDLHEHCAFCWRTFSLAEEDEHVGYVLEDGAVWVCEKCFSDFRERFNWSLHVS